MSLNLYISHLWQPYLSAAHISDPNIPAKHLLLKFLMMGTGIQYLFHERDIEEFLIRLHLSYKHFNVLECFLMEDHFFEAKVNGEQVELTTQDLQEAQGIIHSPNSQRLTREEWLPFATKGWKDVTVAGIFADVSLHAIKQEKEKVFVIEEKSFNHEITDQILSDTKLFAREVMKEMDFKKLRSWHAEKKSLIEEIRTKFIKPFHYDEQSIPSELRLAILNYLAKYGYGDESYEPDMYHEEVEENTIYLAWLYANNLVIKDLQGFWTVDGNFGFNYEALEDTFDCNFYDVIPFLKLDEFKEQLKAPIGALPNSEMICEAYELI